MRCQHLSPVIPQADNCHTPTWVRLAVLSEIHSAASIGDLSPKWLKCIRMTSQKPLVYMLLSMTVLLCCPQF